MRTHYLRRIAILFLSLVGLGLSTAAQAAGRWCSSSDVMQFGNHAVGSTAASSVTVSNCGDAAWSFTDVSVHSATGPAFTVNTTCSTGRSLAPNESCTVSVLFTPTSPGQASGALWLRNTTNTPTQLLTFYGRGTDAQAASASLTFVPANVVFATQEIGKQSPAIAVELRNAGPAALIPSALVLNGPEAYEFVGYPVTCKVGVAIPAGQSCQLMFYFTPQQAGLRRASLVVDAPQLPSLAIMPISGIGAAAVPPPANADPPPTPNIPTNSTEGLALLVLGMIALGWRALRNRRTNEAS